MKRITRRKEKTIKGIKLANLGHMVAPIHNFDPKWVKKGLAPSKNPLEWPICVLPALKKKKNPHIARRISEAAMGVGRVPHIS